MKVSRLPDKASPSNKDGLLQNVQTKQSTHETKSGLLGGGTYNHKQTGGGGGTGGEPGRPVGRSKSSLQNNTGVMTAAGGLRDSPR